VIRFVLSAIAQLIANAVALLVANYFLDDMELNASGFLTAVVIFTVAEVLLLPFFRQMAFSRARALAGSTALVAAFGALVVTVIFSDDIQIDGLTTWVVATLIVWGASLITTLLLPVFVFKSLRDERRDRSA
jgi:putative membrane protein